MQRPVNEAQGFCLQFLLKHQFSKSLRTGAGGAAGARDTAVGVSSVSA